MIPQTRSTAELVALMMSGPGHIGAALRAHPDAMTDVLAALERLAALDAAEPASVASLRARADLVKDHQDPAARELAKEAMDAASALTSARAEVARLTADNARQHAVIMAWSKHGSLDDQDAVAYMARLRRDHDAQQARAEELLRGLRLVLRMHDLPPRNTVLAREWLDAHGDLLAQEPT